MKKMNPEAVTRPSAAILALALATLLSAAERLPPPPPTVTVLGKTLALKTNTASEAEELVAEYVPEKETVDHWTQMLGVRVYKGKVTPDQALAMKDQEVQARRGQGDVMANSMAFAKGDFKTNRDKYVQEVERLSKDVLK